MNKPVMKAPAGENFTKQLPTEGMVNAKCYAVVDMWQQENEWKGVKKLQRQIQISFETDQMWEFGDKWTLPLTIHNTYSFFITDTSNLQKDLTSWLGAPQTSEFNVFDLVWKTAELMILHKVSKAGKTNAKIMAIKPGKKDWTLINPEVMFSLDSFDADEFLKLPSWLQKKIQATPDYNKAAGIEEDTPPASTNDDDDLPF